MTCAARTGSSELSIGCHLFSAEPASEAHICPQLLIHPFPNLLHTFAAHTVGLHSFDRAALAGMPRLG